MENSDIWSEVDGGMPEDPHNNKRRNKQRMKRWKKILIAVISVIVGLIAVLAICFLVLRISGKSRIYRGVAGKKPTLGQSVDDLVDANKKPPELDVDYDSLDDINSIETTEQGNPGEMTTAGGAASGNSGNSGSTPAQTVKDPSKNPGEPASNQTTRPTAAPPGEKEYDVMYLGEKYKYNKDIITLLFLGIDKMEKVEPAEDGISGGQSDTIMLLVLNPHTKVMDIIAVPRDTIAVVDIYDREGNFDKRGLTQICLQHGYGDGMALSNKRATEAISKLFHDLPIHATTSVNKGGISALSDAIGGVTLTSLYTFDTPNNKFVEGQSVTLKGEMAFDYLSSRDCNRHFTAGERLERQKQYLNECKDQVIAAVKKDAKKVINIYDAVKDYVVTTLKLDEMTYLASEAVGYKFGAIHTLKGNVDTSRKYERYYLDEEAFEKLIIDMFYEKVK